MIRLPEEKACFLSTSVATTPGLAALLQLLKLVSVNLIPITYHILAIVNWS